MTKTTSRNWAYRVVKSQRGMNGKWFRYPTAATFDFEADARAYAEGFAAEQTAAGVIGTRINVLTRGDVDVAEFRVG